MKFKLIKFKTVITKDRNGKVDSFEVIDAEEKDRYKFSCTFKNSSGDIEKQLVYLEQLHWE